MLDKFEQAARDGDFTNTVAEARDMLRPILTGQIEREHGVGLERECYGKSPGFRKTKLADAVKIAKTIEIVLNKAINKFLDESND
jgi:hypothetical protein